MAGVGLLSKELSNQRKLDIAAQLGFSETAYVTVIGDKFRFEYFTPTEEVPLCGHATIAAFVVIRDKFSPSKDTYVIETKSGDLSVTLDGDMIFMEQNNPRFYETIQKSDIAACFDMDFVNDKLPIKIGTTGLRDIILPVKSLETLETMKPNLDEISKISHKFDTVGIHAFCFSEERIICRNFAPRYGIPEESATGTSNCVLAGYLWHNNIRKNEYIFEQGYSLNSPSEIIVRLTTDGDDISRVFVGGAGYVGGKKSVK